LPAGDFSSWLRNFREGQKSDAGAEVPCGECFACCSSSYFIHVRADEVQTLSIIPKELLFPAPGLAVGNMVLGFDEEGRCPMLIQNKCSIYDHRPLTCRSYDCRIFPATGIDADDDAKRLISDQIERWKFRFPEESDHKQLVACQKTARFLHTHDSAFPAKTIPRNSTQLAVLALKVYKVLYNSEKMGSEISEAEIVLKILEVKEEFEAKRNSPKDQSS